MRSLTGSPSCGVGAHRWPAGSIARFLLLAAVATGRCGRPAQPDQAASHKRIELHAPTLGSRAACDSRRAECCRSHGWRKTSPPAYGVDTEVGLEIQFQVEHVSRIAGFLHGEGQDSLLHRIPCLRRSRGWCGCVRLYLFASVRNCWRGNATRQIRPLLIHKPDHMRQSRVVAGDAAGGPRAQWSMPDGELAEFPGLRSRPRQEPSRSS